MASVSIYLNFAGNAEEAFTAYKKIFNTEFSTPVMRMGDMPPQPGMAELSESDKNKVMHVSLPILDGTQIMASDVLESFGQQYLEGNNVTISLNPDTREEANRLYNELSVNGTGCVAPHDEFWGYWGTCKDKYGVRWMFNITNS